MEVDMILDYPCTTLIPGVVVLLAGIYSFGDWE